MIDELNARQACVIAACHTWEIVIPVVVVSSGCFLSGHILCYCVSASIQLQAGRSPGSDKRVVVYSCGFAVY